MPVTFGQEDLAIVYAPGIIGLCIWLAPPTISVLFIRLRSFIRAIAHFLPARPRLYIASFLRTPGLCRLGVRSPLALGHEYACRGICLHAALVLEQPNHDSLRLRSLTMLVILMIRVREY